MRQVFGNPPSDGRIVKKEIRRLSKKLGVEPPRVAFWLRGDAEYNPGERIISIPEWEWALTYDPYLFPEKYWCLVMHEYAHHLYNLWNESSGWHNARFYSILTGIVMAQGIPMDIFQEEENWYKPMSLRNGKYLAGWKLLESHKKETSND